MSLAPLVADGKVMVGASGGELGIRGFVAAFDVDTGKPAVEDLHRPGARRAGQRDVAEGRSVEDRRRVDLGDRQLRSGDEPRVLGHRQRRPVDGRSAAGRQPLHLVDDRDRRGAPARSRATFSTIPNDSWDWDEVSPPILVDYQRNGRTIKGLIDVARNGYLWFLERTAGRIKFVEGKPFVKQNVFRSLDPKTGRPDVDPARQPGHRQGGRVLPVALGRQELAADRVQSEDADDLHPGQRESLLDRWSASRSRTPRGAASPARPAR